MANLSPQAPATLGSFNAAPAQDAERTVLACCASRTFAKAIADGAASGGMSAAEQSGAAAAGDEVRQGLADGNLAYEQRFGHIFLICASGLSGQAMLTQLRDRLGNDQEAERTVVRAELRKITRLRMTKLLNL